jgi:CelD/BcsL family acetyltransferase involved in cellulose biosynthesis
MSHRDLRLWVADGFDDPRLGRTAWTELVGRGDSPVVFLTWEWQRTWWESFERSGLMLLAAAPNGRMTAIAPLFAEDGMAYFVGSGGSDYLDFIGDVDSDVVTALLDAAREQVDGFVGFRFYHVRDTSRTGDRLRAAAARLGLSFIDEGEMPAPYLDMRREPETSLRLANKASLLRRENRFLRDGPLEVVHLADGDAILPELEGFMEQHVRRWAATPTPSLFLDPRQRTFYRRLTETAARAGWLRFTRLSWNDRAVAYHYGFRYGDDYLYYKPTFDVEIASRSPGLLLMHHLLSAAHREGVRVFDLGLGDEEYKRRFANASKHVQTWGLYRSSSGQTRRRCESEIQP